MRSLNWLLKYLLEKYIFKISLSKWELSHLGQLEMFRNKWMSCSLISSWLCTTLFDRAFLVPLFAGDFTNFIVFVWWQSLLSCCRCHDSQNEKCNQHIKHCHKDVRHVCFDPLYNNVLWTMWNIWDSSTVLEQSKAVHVWEQSKWNEW